MNDNIHERETRRIDIIDCINKGYGVSEIARRLDVPRWAIIRDIKRMRHHRDSGLKEAYTHAREQAQAKKQLTANLPDEKFHRMTGMTFEEKTRNNMMFFYRHELRKILNSENEGDAIRELSNSVKKTMKRNGIINTRWKCLQITEYARAYLTGNLSVNR